MFPETQCIVHRLWMSHLLQGYKDELPIMKYTGLNGTNLLQGYMDELPIMKYPGLNGTNFCFSHGLRVKLFNQNYSWLIFNNFLIAINA